MSKIREFNEVKPEELLPFVDSVSELSLKVLQEAIDNTDDCTANFFEGSLVGFGFSSCTRTIITDQLDLQVPQGIPFNSRNAKRYGIEMVRKEDTGKRQYI